MANKIQIKRGMAADMPALDVAEFGLAVDTGQLYIGTSSGNVLVSGGANPPPIKICTATTKAGIVEFIRGLREGDLFRMSSPINDFTIDGSTYHSYYIYTVSSAPISNPVDDEIPTIAPVADWIDGLTNIERDIIALQDDVNDLQNTQNTPPVLTCTATTTADIKTFIDNLKEGQIFKMSSTSGTTTYNGTTIYKEYAYLVVNAKGSSGWSSRANIKPAFYLNDEGLETISSAANLASSDLTYEMSVRTYGSNNQYTGIVDAVENLIDDVEALQNGSGSSGSGGSSSGDIASYMEAKGIKTAHTTNMDDYGNTGGSYYGDNEAWTKVLTVSGASYLRVTVTYQSESDSYDWGCVWTGSNSSYTAANNYSTSFTGKLGGTTKQTKVYEVTGDTVTVAWKSDGSNHNYYGFYVVVEPIPQLSSSGGGGSSSVEPHAATIVVAASNSKYTAGADFVCTGSGDQNTISAAISALPSAGGKVLLLEGDYSFSGTLTLGKSYVTVEGMGGGTTITFTGSNWNGPIQITGDNIAVKNMWITHSSSGTFGGCGIYITATYAKVSDVTIVGFSYGLNMTASGKASYNRIINVTAKDGSIGLHCNTNRAMIANCFCVSTPTGIRIEGSYNMICDNYIAGSSPTYTIYNQGSYNQFAGNYLIGKDYTSSGTGNVFNGNTYVTG